MTGPTGTIGTALIRQCVRQGVEVYALCRRHSARRDRIPEHEGVHVVECGLEELARLDAADFPGCDAFYHLGWAGTTGDARNDMGLQLDNVRYTLDAVAAACRLGCRVFIGAGSQAEYGRVEGRLEPSTPAFPETGYGMAKLCAGQMSRRECGRLGIRHIWARILSVYGPYDSESSMVMSSIRKLLAGEKPLFTKGEQRWDYLYCEDAARALFLLGELGKDQKIYCIGSGAADRLENYIRIIGEQTNPQVPLGIGEVPYSENQVMYLCADIRQLQEDTGFRPKVSFEEGIRNTVDWAKAQRPGAGSAE